jgi:dual specificity phosphatase 12
MLTERMSSTTAQYSIRCVRDLIWIRPILVEQLVLFEVCQHQPHEDHPVYRAWRERMLLQPAAALVLPN